MSLSEAKKFVRDWHLSRFGIVGRERGREEERKGSRGALANHRLSRLDRSTRVVKDDTDVKDDSKRLTRVFLMKQARHQIIIAG